MFERLGGWLRETFGGGGDRDNGGGNNDRDIEKINAENDRKRELENQRIANERAQESHAQKERDQREYQASIDAQAEREAEQDRLAQEGEAKAEAKAEEDAMRAEQAKLQEQQAKETQAKAQAEVKEVNRIETDRLQGIRDTLGGWGVDTTKYQDTDLDTALEDTQSQVDSSREILKSWGVDVENMRESDILGSINLQKGLEEGRGDIWATQGLASGEMNTDYVNESGIPTAMENVPLVYNRDSNGSLIVSTASSVGDTATNTARTDGMSYNMETKQMQPTSEIINDLTPTTITEETQPEAAINAPDIISEKDNRPEQTQSAVEETPVEETPEQQTDLLNTFVRDQRALGIEQGTYGEGLAGRYGSLTGEQLNKLAQALRR